MGLPGRRGGLGTSGGLLFGQFFCRGELLIEGCLGGGLLGLELGLLSRCFHGGRLRFRCRHELELQAPCGLELSLGVLA